MVRAYSLDLRERVVAAVLGGLSCETAVLPLTRWAANAQGFSRASANG